MDPLRIPNPSLSHERPQKSYVPAVTPASGSGTYRDQTELPNLRPVSRSMDQAKQVRPSSGSAGGVRNKRKKVEELPATCKRQSDPGSSWGEMFGVVSKALPSFSLARKASPIVFRERGFRNKGLSEKDLEMGLTSF